MLINAPHESFQSFTLNASSHRQVFKCLLRLPENTKDYILGLRNTIAFQCSAKIFFVSSVFQWPQYTDILSNSEKAQFRLSYYSVNAAVAND